MNGIPVIDENLINYLDKIYPDIAPGLLEGLDMIRTKSGAVSVVRHLKAIYQQQQENMIG